MKKSELKVATARQMIEMLRSWGISIRRAKISTIDRKCPTCSTMIVPSYQSVERMTENVVGFFAYPPFQHKMGKEYEIIRRCCRCGEYVYHPVSPDDIRTYINSTTWPDEAPEPKQTST
jgi:hypothetical protein